VKKPLFLLPDRTLPLLEAAVTGDRRTVSALSARHPKTANSLTSVTKRILDEQTEMAKIARTGIDSMRQTVAILVRNGAFAKENRLVMDNVTSVATAVEEMAATATEISRAAQETAERANDSNAKSVSGNEAISTLMGNMGLVEGAVREMADSMNQFIGFSREINKLTAIVRDIAHQTNLLALNAAIEAARAGEAGRGFAVVADEVKKLADKTAQATGEIESVTNTMNSLSSTVGESVRTSLQRVTESNESLETVAMVFSENSGAVRDVNDRVHQIAAAAEQQSVVSGEMARNLADATAVLKNEGRQVEAISQHAQAGAESSRQQFELLAGLGHERLLLQVVKADHLMWKAKLADVIHGRLHLTDGELKDHTQCRLGKWYYSTGREQHGDSAAFRAMEAPHAAVHRLGREIAALAARGDLTTAVEKLEEMDALSAQLFEQIDRLSGEIEQ
jgi:methyl-accepting chemotaxis protein